MKRLSDEIVADLKGIEKHGAECGKPFALHEQTTRRELRSLKNFRDIYPESWAASLITLSDVAKVALGDDFDFNNDYADFLERFHCDET